MVTCKDLARITNGKLHVSDMQTLANPGDYEVAYRRSPPKLPDLESGSMREHKMLMAYIHVKSK